MELNRYGIYHPFRFVSSKNEINEGVIYEVTSSLYFVLSGFDDVEFTSIEVTDIITGSILPSTFVSYSWVIDDNNRTSLRCRIQPTSGKYIVKINKSFGNSIYVDGIIVKTDCVGVIQTKNSCTNDYHDWDGDAELSTLNIHIPYASDMVNDYEDEELTVFTQEGKRTVSVNNTDVHKFVFVAPLGYKNMLHACKRNDFISFDGLLCKNFNYEAESLENGLYGKFTVSFETIRSINNSECCDVINIDDIVSGEYDGGAVGCGAFAIEIINTNNVLSVNLTDPPIGSPSYKWFKNGVQIANTPTIAVSGGGTYTVYVKVLSCTKTSSYFIENVCELFNLSVTSSNDQIDAVVSNVPAGETVTYEIIFNGSIVGTTLPHTAVATGNYFVRAKAGDCSKVRGIYVDITAEEIFSLSINQNNNILEAVTDATSPTYLWELEKGSGRITIGSAATVEIQGKGIYWLTVNGKSVYKYLEPSAAVATCVLYKATGFEFSVYEIDLVSIYDPNLELEVFANGIRLTYTSGTPTNGQYSINNLTGKLITFAAVPFNNATIFIYKK